MPVARAIHSIKSCHRGTFSEIVLHWPRTPGLGAESADMTLHLVAREPRARALTVDPRRQRDAVEIDEATWRRVTTYADRLLVVATETSRLTGAGAGIVDTD